MIQKPEMREKLDILRFLVNFFWELKDLENLQKPFSIAIVFECDEKTKRKKLATCHSGWLGLGENF